MSREEGRTMIPPPIRDAETGSFHPPGLDGTMGRVAGLGLAGHHPASPSMKRVMGGKDENQGFMKIAMMRPGFTGSRSVPGECSTMRWARFAGGMGMLLSGVA